MTDINNLVVVGRLTKDPELKYSQTGLARLSVSIAVNRSRKQGEQWIDEASFFDVIVWGKQAESLSNRIARGSQIVISGFLKQDKWQDQQGQSRSKVYIVAESVQGCGNRSQSAPMSGQGQNIPPQVQQVAQAFGGEVYTQQNGEFPEDIPF